MKSNQGSPIAKTCLVASKQHPIDKCEKFQTIDLNKKAQFSKVESSAFLAPIQLTTKLLVACIKNTIFKQGSTRLLSECRSTRPYLVKKDV